MLYLNENIHGGDVYTDKVVLDFSVNINPFGTPESVTDAIRSCAYDVVNYPDPYCRELVSAISDHDHVPPEWIICGNGAAELIYSYCRAIGKVKAAQTAPAFSEYAAGIKQSEGSMVRYPLKEENGFALDGGFMAFLDKEKPDVVFLCNPNNPDGRNIPFTLLEEILGWCGEHGGKLFIDECFLDLSDYAESMKKFLPSHSQLFVLKAFTKNYGMAGVRLGYGLCSDAMLLKRMSESVQPWNVSIPAQKAGVAALKEIGFVTEARELIKRERPWLSAELKKLGYKVYPSEANFLLLKDSADKLDEILKPYGILVRNCSNYYGLGNGWYRICVRTHADNSILVKILNELIKFT